MKSMLKYILSILYISTALCFADPRIDDLINQLGASSFKDRKKAEQALWELLPESEAALRKASESSDPEVKIRANRVLDKYEKGILPGVTEEIKLKIEQFWESKTKSLFLRDWLYGSEFKDINFVIHLIKLADKRGEHIRIGKFISERDLFSRVYSLYPNSKQYEFFIRKFAEEGSYEFYENWVRANNNVNNEIEYYEKNRAVNDSRRTSLLLSLYEIKGDKAKVEELSKNNLHKEYMKLLKQRKFKDILANKRFTQGSHPIEDERTRLLFHRLSGDKESYKLAKQSFMDEFAQEVKKNNHLGAVHALICNGEMKDATEVSLKLEPMWYSRILTIGTDLEKKLAFAQKQKNSNATAYIAFEYYRLFKKDECKKWLEKSRLSELSDRWLFYYIKAYVYAYGLEAAFEHVADDFPTIQSNSRRQVFYALCPEFNTLASYVVGYRKDTLKDNFLLLKKFVTKSISGEDLEEFYNKVGTNNGRVSEYRIKLVYEAASYLNDEEKLKSFRKEFLKFDRHKLYLAKHEVLNQNFKEALKLLDDISVKDSEFLFYLYLKTKCYKELGDAENSEKFLGLLKKAPVNSVSLSKEFLDFLEDQGDKEIAAYFLNFYQYRPTLSSDLLQRLVEHNIEKEDFAQAEFYSIHYYFIRNRGTSYSYPSYSLRVYLNFVNIEIARCIKEKKAQEALTKAYEILAITPHIYDFHVGVVNSLKKAGFVKESDEYYQKYMNHYEKMIEFSDINSTALNDWAWSAALCDRNLQLAEKRSRLAVKLAPGNANLLDTLAEVLFRQGRVEEAVKTQEKASQLAPLSKYSSFRSKLTRFKASLKK